MPTADKLSYLQGTKEAIKAAIINHGVSVSDTDTFRSYADKIRTISSSSSSTDHSLEDAILQDTLTDYTNNRITKLRDSALRATNNLTSVNFPNVLTIGKEALAYNESLTSITMPLLTDAGEAAFLENYILTSINLPSLKNIGLMGFMNCFALESAEFASLTDIPTQCFFDCESLTSLTLSSTTMTTLGATNAFTGTPIASGEGYIYVPASLVDTYKTATNWSTYAKQIKAIGE